MHIIKVISCDYLTYSLILIIVGFMFIHCAFTILHKGIQVKGPRPSLFSTQSLHLNMAAFVIILTILLI